MYILSRSSCIAALAGLVVAQNAVHTGTWAITNVHVFDGWDILPGIYTVGVRDGIISSIVAGESSTEQVAGQEIIDGRGQFLLPGFLDTHVHVDNAPTDLINMRAQGITTAFDMACHVGKAACDARNLARHAPDSTYSLGSAEHAAFVANVTSLGPFPELFHAYNPAIAPVGSNSFMVSPEQHVKTAEQARSHVAQQVAYGANHIKILSTTPGFDLEMLKVLVAAAKDADKITVCHAADVDAFVNAAKAGCDQLHHSPLDGVLTPQQVQVVQASRAVVSATLIQMKGVSSAFDASLVVLAMDIWKSVSKFTSGSVWKTISRLVSGGGMQKKKLSFLHAKENIRLLSEANVPLIVGTDATGDDGTFFLSVHMRSGFQTEVGLLKDVGINSERILRGMTGLAAEKFRLSDRGRIQEGRRADMVLLGGNPVDDLDAVKQVQMVWIGGLEADLGHETSAPETKDEL